MKTLQLIITLLLVSTFGYAQNGINYKAVIKNDLGNVIANSSVDIKFQILESDILVNVYEETHTPTTDNNGIIIINIGEGTVITGAFDDINWGEDNHYLNVKINTGSGFTDMGTTQFSAVPYAFHAKKAANVKGLEAIDEGNGIGWRLVDRNTDNYGNIGNNAVDLSYSTSNTQDFGATGFNGFATGFLTTASGDRSTAMGNNTTASGLNSIALGLSTDAIGENSVAMGGFTEALGDFSLAFGNGSESRGNNSIAMGDDSFATSDYAVAIGRDAFASGQNALALGYNTVASGEYSTAIGRQTEASAEYATAMGHITRASGEWSTAMGYNTEASGGVSTALGANTTASMGGSTAMGSSTTASEFATTAMGRETTASGAISTAMGNNTIASGRSSTAMGIYTLAPSYGETTIGSYSTEYNPLDTDAFNSTDRLFTIGNGTNSFNRSNAITILKNGNTGIGTDTPQERLHIANGRLRIGSETIEDTGNNRLSFNADLLPDINEGMQLGNSSFRWLGLWAADGTINTSDRRSKTNIKAIDYGLNEVLKMNPVSYNWKNRKNQDTKLGLIAQDLLKIVPEVVMTHEWKATSDDENALLEKVALDRLGVYYSDLIPVLINAIKEQQKIIDNEKLINAKQNSQLEALLSRIEDLEANQSN